MNGRMSKKLRKMAKMEMSGNATTVDRELVLARVAGGDRIINEPLTVRAMYLKLKWALKESVRNPKARVISSDF